MTENDLSDQECVNESSAVEIDSAEDNESALQSVNIQPSLSPRRSTSDKCIIEFGDGISEILKVEACSAQNIALSDALPSYCADETAPPLSMNIDKCEASTSDLSTSSSEANSIKPITLNEF